MLTCLVCVSREHIKKQRHYFTNKGSSCQGCGFSNSHVWMWELDYKEDWAPKNWCFWTMVLEKTLESPLDCREIQPVHSKGDQSWVFIGGIDAEAEAPILWPPDAKSWLILKTLMLGKIEGWWSRGDRGWDGWMASPTRWTWVWVYSGSWWWTGRPGVLRFMRSQRVRHNWVTELNWTESKWYYNLYLTCTPLQCLEVFLRITFIDIKFFVTGTDIFVLKCLLFCLGFSFYFVVV